MKDHSISSNVFLLLEEKTLPTVWFYSFSLLKDTAELNLSGEAENVKVFSQQIAVFEKSSYIKNVNVVDLKHSSSDGVMFILKIHLDPKIFNYKSNPLVLYE